MRFWKDFRKYFFWFSIILLLYKNVSCDPISNYKFNASHRDYFTSEDAAIQNKSEVKTLQNLDYHSYKENPYIRKPIRFEEGPDNALSSSSHGRGFHHGDYPGPYSYDYEASPYEGHGHHELYHQSYHGHHVEHHHKHHDHGLDAKAFLWPLAGLALLGAAATLVTNPVLLQLGVVTGRKRRSTDYEDTTALSPELLKHDWNSFGNATSRSKRTKEDNAKRRPTLRYNNMKYKTIAKIKSSMSTTPKIYQMTLDLPPKNDESFNDRRYVPVHLKMKKDT